MEEKNSNLRYYELGREVPKEAQKDFDNGKFKGTDINPMWRIKKLTELFGPCGIGWCAKIDFREMKEAKDGTVCTFVGVSLYVKENGEWSLPIYGEGGNTFVRMTKNGVSVTDEAYKMAYTDALSNAAKMLGIGADIWFANDKEHSTKYDLQMEQRKDEQKQPAAPQKLPSVATNQQAHVDNLKQQLNGVDEQETTSWLTICTDILALGSKAEVKSYLETNGLKPLKEYTASDVNADDLKLIEDTRKKLNEKFKK